MPKLIRDLKVFEISSVDKAANESARVLIRKRTGQENEMQTLDVMVDDYVKIHKVDRPHAYANVMATPAGSAQYRAERDARFSKIASPMNTPLVTGAGLSPASQMTDSDNLEQMTRQYMKDNPDVKHKSVAYRAVIATEKGRVLLERDKQANLRSNHA